MTTPKSCLPIIALAALAAPKHSAGAYRFELSAVVTDEAGKPVKDAVVFVYKMKQTGFKPPLHPYVMDQIDKEFVPHVLPVLVGSQVRFPNKDDIHHHLYSFSPAKTFELPLYKGEPADPVTFDKAGVVKLGCNIHDWMSGIILVLPNPYFARTDSEGRAALSVPGEGTKTLAVFHERLKVSVEQTQKKLRPGSQAVELNWQLPLRAEHKKKRPAVGYK